MFSRFADERGSAFRVVVEVIGLIAGILGIWQFLASYDLVPGPGPIQIVEDVFDEPTPNPTIDGPDDIDGLQRLDPPTGLTLSGCVLSWDPVDGAESYRIERDGYPYIPQTTDTSIDLSMQPGADAQTHTFGVIAQPPPLGGIESLSSDTVSADC